MKRLTSLVPALLLMLFAAFGNAQDVLNTTPSRSFGHAQFFSTHTTDAPNLVEGREFNQPMSIAVDRTASPAVLYVSDTFNNRILGWRDARNFGNGSQADFVIGQVDFFTTLEQGPRGQGRNSVGLTGPTGLVVDGQGNLYVADSGNNRILRFPKPYQQAGSVKVPDLVLGQKDFTGREENAGGRSAATLRLSFQNTLPAIGLALDGQGNLWVPDLGNNRILRFPAGVLTANNHGANADIVLGPPNFTDFIFIGLNPQDRLRKDILREPSHLAFDAAGNLYASDSLARVVVYTAPLSTGKQISRIAGVPVGIQGQPDPPVDRVGMGLPQGLAFIGNKLAVADAAFHRVLILPELSAWPAESRQFSPTAEAVLGQFNFAGNSPNRGLSEPVGGSLRNPRDLLFLPDGGSGAQSLLYIADGGNNRVLAFPGSNFSPDSVATKFLGQEGLEYGGINRVEGREVAFVNRGGIVVDRKSDPPRLYIADPGNNRVLGFRSLWSALSGGTADLVIGQLDTRRVTVNYPSGEAGKPNDTGLNQPQGVALDSDGNLWVADTGNGRVLRFPKPFDQGNLFLQKADVVLGKPNLTAGPLPVATDTNLNGPYDLAFTTEGHMLVSDVADHRVLLFMNDGGFMNGKAVSKVFGQPDAFTNTPGNSDNKMASPRGIALDTDGGRLYVTDTGNDRVLIFDRVLAAPANPAAARTLTATFADAAALRQPTDVLVDEITGQFWVADFANVRVVRYPRFRDLQAGATANGRIFGTPDNANRVSEAPITLASSGSGDLLVGSSANRIALYVPPLVALNAANFLVPGGLEANWPQSFFRTGALSNIIQQFPPLCPNAFSSLFPLSTNFGSQTLQFTQFPNPIPVRKELGGYQVRVNGVPAPMLLLSPGQINLVVPKDAPQSGNATFEVLKPATGQVIASAQLPMAESCPALFTRDQNGIGQIAAVNQDDTINSPQNPAARRSVISLFGTGAGAVPGAPEDGALVTGQLNTTEKPQVIINTGIVPPESVQYSGLKPGQLAGLWQINVAIPESVPPSDKVIVVVLFKSRQSNQSNLTQKIETTISVKQ